MVAELLLGGADPNRSNRQGTTALMLAAGARHPHIVLSLLNAKADAALRDAKKETAYDIAKTIGDSETLAALQ